MLLLAVLLLFGLRWTAEEIPNWDDQSHLAQIDDRYTLILRSSSNNDRWSTYVNRFFLLDGKHGVLHKILPPESESIEPTYGHPFFRILPDGRIYWTRDDSLHAIHITTPQSLLTRTISTHDRPALVGDRFLISQASPGQKNFRWYDLQAATLDEHQTELTTYHSTLSSIPGSKVPFFYDLYVPSLDTVSPSDSATSETESEQTATIADDSENSLDFEESQPRKHPAWESELKSLRTRIPNAHPSFNQFAMFILYRMTEVGPYEVAHWPVGIEESYAPEFFISADDIYIFCLALDAQSIEVHDATTGEIRCRIPFPIGKATPASVTWRANRFAISLFNGTTWQTFDTRTGRPLPNDSSIGIVLSVQGDRYLTLAPHIPNTAANLAFNAWPPRLQVRRYPTGEILSSYLMPDRQASLAWSQLTEDGQQVILHTGDERILYLDALTGSINQVIQASTWPYYACLLIAIMLVVWIGAWIRTCDRAGLPRLITMLVVTAIVIAFLLMRLQLSGHPHLRLRLAIVAILAISTAWSAELSQHLMRPGCSLLSRTLAVSAYLICIYLIPMQLIRHYDMADTIVACILMHGLLATFYLLLRRTGHLPPYGSNLVNRQFSLSAILVITALAAVAISVGYRQSWSHLSLSDPLDVPANLLGIALIAALTLAVRHSVRLRTILIPICMALAYFVHLDRYGWAPWCWPFSMYLACTSIACSFVVAPLPGTRESLSNSRYRTT